MFNYNKLKLCKKYINHFVPLINYYTFAIYIIAKQLIDELISKKAKGDKFQESNVKIKLILKGIIPDEITESTPDTEEMIKNIFKIAQQFNIELTK